jgi:hypothetical protein
MPTLSGTSPPTFNNGYRTKVTCIFSLLVHSLRIIGRAPVAAEKEFVIGSLAPYHRTGPRSGRERVPNEALKPIETSERVAEVRGESDGAPPHPYR